MFLLGTTVAMKINLIKKIILNNKILILLFVLLIACDSGSDSNSNSEESMPTPSPTPTIIPTAMPTAQPLVPPQAPPTNPSAPGAPSNPAPSPTNQPSPPNPPATPIPTSSPTQAPPTSSPAPLPTATPRPTATPSPSPTRPPMSPPGGPLNDFQSEVLDLVNEARAQPRNCGNDFFPSAPPVTWDERIEDAASVHSIDMARNQNFSHTGTDGSNAGDRLLMQGYNWNTWGENILVGLDNAPRAIDAWIGSPGHCRIIMNQSLREVGAGIAQGIYLGNTASYWTLLFATEN